MSDGEWKRFEELAFQIQSQLSPNATVKHNDRIIGRDSGRFRQIDVSIRQRLGQYEMLIAVDCKHYRRKVHVKDVEAFAGMVRDIGAHRGTIVSRSGFTATAKRLASCRGIDTYRLVDTSNIDWAGCVQAPMLLDRIFIESFRWVVKDPRNMPRSWLERDPGRLNLFAGDGVLLGSVRDVLARSWNLGLIRQEPGEQEYTLVQHGIVGRADSGVRATFCAVLRVSQEYWYGSVPGDLQGFWDEQGNQMFTRELTAHQLEPAAIVSGRIPGWCRIANPDALATHPLFCLSFCDVYELRDL